MDGTELGDMAMVDWGRMLGSAAIFGSAFLWIALALETLHPGMVAFGRALLGAAALSLVSAARCRISRPDWPRLVMAAAFGVAGPVFLFALAEQRIPSAVAGMAVSGIPIFTAVVAAIETRSWPTKGRAGGLALGAVGILLLAAPNLGGGGGDLVGLLLVLSAVVAYSIATTLYAPLQQTYGALRVTMWVLTVSSIILLPLGIVGWSGSSWSWTSASSLLVLGVVGTGIVWAVFVGLVGRVGAVRASVAGYLVPIFALVLGVLVLDDRVEPIQVIGVLVTLVGGFVVTRAVPHRTAAAEVKAASEPSAEPAAIQMCR